MLPFESIRVSVSPAYRWARLRRHLHRSLSQILGAWVRVVLPWRLPVLLWCLLAALGAIHYVMGNLAFDLDMRTLMAPGPESLDWRRADLEYANAFPQYRNRLLITVQALAPDAALDATRWLHGELLLHPELYVSLYYPPVRAFHRRMALLYLDRWEFESLTRRLGRLQPALSLWAADPTLRGLFGMLRQSLEQGKNTETFEYDLLFEHLGWSLEELGSLGVAQAPRLLSWQGLLEGREVRRETQEQTLLAGPRLDDTRLQPAAAALAFLHTLRDHPELRQRGAQLRLGGEVVVAHEGIGKLVRGIRNSAWAGILLAVLLWRGLGSVRMALYVTLTLFCGLCLTVSMILWGVGRLSLISILFFALYIALSTDFAVLYSLRYRDWIHRGKSPAAALQRSARDSGACLITCALSAVVGGYALALSFHRDAVELAWITGTAMAISLLLILTLLPALISCWPPRWPPLKTRVPVAGGVAPGVFICRHRRPILLFLLLGLTVSIFSFRYPGFDDSTAISSPGSPLPVIQELPAGTVPAFCSEASGGAAASWVLLVEDAAAAQAAAARLEALSGQVRVFSLADFVPSGQEWKLPILAGLSVRLGDRLPSKVLPPPKAWEQEYALREFARVSAALSVEGTALWRLHMHLERLLEELESLPPESRTARLAALEWQLLGLLPGRLADLRAALQADRIGETELPPWLRARWLNSDGQHLLYVHPRPEFCRELAAAGTLFESLRREEPRMIGSPQALNGADRTLPVGRLWRLWSALAVLTMLLLWCLPRRRDVLLVLPPLCFAACAAWYLAARLAIPRHLVDAVLPLLFAAGAGGLACAVYSFRRFSSRSGDEKAPLPRVVPLAVLTTLLSIGNLSLWPHEGIAGMARLLALGVALAWFCSLALLLVLPMSSPLRSATVRVDEGGIENDSESAADRRQMGA